MAQREFANQTALVAYAEQNADGIVKLVCDNNIKIAVEVYITNGNPIRLPSYGIAYLRLKRVIPVAQQHRDCIVRQEAGDNYIDFAIAVEVDNGKPFRALICSN